MKTENICEKCGKFFKRTIANYQKKPRFCSMKCRGHTGFRPGGNFRTNEESNEEKFKRMMSNFEKNVIRSDDCWKWKGTLDKNGYARLSLRSIPCRHAHVASFLMHKGAIPENFQVNHLCHIRSCSNPEHLYLGTQKDNMNDKMAANRQAKGSKNGNSKLDESQVREIKNFLKSGEHISQIARIFDVSNVQIGNIKKNKQWKHVGETCLDKS